MTYAAAIRRNGEQPYRARGRAWTSFNHALSQALIVVLVIVQVYPLVWIFLTALRPAQEFAAGNPFALPSTITLDNFVRAFEQGDLRRYMLNSALVTGVSDVGIVILGMMAAYAIQVLQFKFSRAVLALFLIGSSCRRT